MTIFYFDALAGAGKTRVLNDEAARRAGLHRKILFAQPSRLLIDKTVADMKARHPKASITKIYGNDERACSGVIKRLCKHFIDADAGGEVVFVTHAALLRAPFLQNAKDWTLFIDEVPGVDVFEELRVPETHGLVTDLVEFTQASASYALLEPKAGLGKIAENKSRDEMLAGFQDLASRICSPHWQVFALQSSYRKLTAEDGTQPLLTTFPLLNPTIFEPFRSTIIASARFTDSMFYRHALNVGVEMQSVGTRLTGKLRYQTHNNGHLLTIRYLMDEDWSKTLGKRKSEFEVDDVCVRNLDVIIAAVSMHFEGRPFAFSANKDVDDGVFDGQEAVRLPNSPHGLNSYQHLHNIAVLTAMNPPPSHFAFVESRQISGDEVRAAHYHSHVYQSVMRISLRNPDDRSPKEVIVIDKGAADYLADLFPGAKVQRMDVPGLATEPGRPGRPKQHGSDVARATSSRERRKDELLALLDLVNGVESFSDCAYPDLLAAVRIENPGFALAHGAVPASSPEQGPAALSDGADPSSRPETCCFENTPIKVVSKHDVSRLWGSGYTSIYDNADPALVELEDEDAFVGSLRSMHRRYYAKKNDNFVFSPAHLVPEIPGVDTGRGLANISHLRGIWLDNDGGDLSHVEFAALFPLLRIVVRNTFSSTQAQPRWRAFIPTTLAMDIHVHRLIMRQIHNTLNKAGYWSREQLKRGSRRKSNLCHGFDVGKFNAASMFYLPCQVEQKINSFFVDYDGEGRHAINPREWIENCEVKVLPEDRTTTAPETEAGKIVAGADCAANTNLPGISVFRSELLKVRERRLAGTNETLCQKAIDAWRSAAPGEGNAAFFRLGGALQYAGMEPYEIAGILEQEAGYARSPGDRRRQIPSILASLGRSGRPQRRSSLG